MTTIGTKQRLRRLSHPVLSEGFARIMNSLAGDNETLIYNPLGKIVVCSSKEESLVEEPRVGEAVWFRTEPLGSR